MIRSICIIFSIFLASEPLFVWASEISNDPLIFARELEVKRDRDSFLQLCSFLTDANFDLSYTAVEALEKRSDKQFDVELVRAIKGITERENRWPAYRMLGKYPTWRVLDYAIGALEDEMSFHKGESTFDSRNAFYLANSIRQIMLHLTSLTVEEPGDESFSDYESFLGWVKEILKRQVGTGK